MTAYLLTLYLVHWLLPGLVLAVVMVTVAGWMPGWRGRRPLVATWRGRFFWTLALNLSLSVAGLAVLGADGKMAMYGALAAASALAQFLMWRGWQA